MLRSLLFVPGHRARFYEKLAEFRPDAVIVDLEDAVPPAEKPLARTTVRERLDGPLLRGLQVFVRVNAVGSAFFAADVQGVVAPGLDGIFLPKAESIGQIQVANMLLAQCELRLGLPMGGIRIVPIVETVLGSLRAAEIVSASPRVLGLAFGAEDFTLDLGVERTRDGIETRYPRAQVALVAHGAGRLAIDTPWTAIDDPQGLERETVEGRQFGYTAKQAIHPSQIATIHAVFKPTDAEVAWAQRVIQAYDDAVAGGTGAINLDGKLIDVPMVARAQRVLERAGLAG
ncbi:MAG: CoA ester lyase [Chloroflexi bacterium]|nr:CoA ester lyase [Chloroflexota bacterium]